MAGHLWKTKGRKDKNIKDHHYFERQLQIKVTRSHTDSLTSYTALQTYYGNASNRAISPFL